MNVAISVGFAFAAIIGASLFVLWFGSAVAIDEHDERIGSLEQRWAETFGGPAEDAAEATLNSVDEISSFAADDDTDEFPVVQPDTAPMPLVVEPTAAVKARRDAAWDTQRPSPVPRKSADWVEEAIKGFNFSGRDR